VIIAADAAPPGHLTGTERRLISGLRMRLSMRRAVPVCETQGREFTEQ
jgi:hypothetical protein